MSNYGKVVTATSALLVVTYLGVRFVLPLFTPFVLALLISALIDPPVSLLAHRAKVPRGLSALVILSVAGLVLGIFIAIGVSEIVQEITALYGNLDLIERNLGQVIDDLVRKGTNVFQTLPGPLADAIIANQGTLFALIRGIAVSLMGIIRGLPQATIILIVTLISTFFITRDRDLISSFIAQAAPPGWRRQLRKVQSELLAGFMGYVRAQLVLLSITSVLSILGLSVMGMNYAWLLGIGAGVLDLVPLIGPSAMYIPWAGYHVIMGNTGTAMGLLTILGVVVLARQLAEARVIGKQLGLHPLVALVSVYVGIRLFGVKGFIVGPLTVIFIKAVLLTVLLPMFPLEEG